MSKRASRRRDQALNTSFYNEHQPHEQQQHGHQEFDSRPDHTIDDNGNFNEQEIIAIERYGSTPNLNDTNGNGTSSSADASVSSIKLEHSLSTNDSSRSESDLSRLRDACTLPKARSELQLQSIASTHVVPESDTHLSNGDQSNGNNDHSSSSISSSSTKTNDESPLSPDEKSTEIAPTNSQMTFCSVSSTVSDTMQLPPRSPSIGFADTSTIRVPIIGYEVMEERARFTVYKLRVENPFTNDCWLVLRRYTDFQRLNNKLKSEFPHHPLTLPRKKIFGDNFSSVFLSNRVQGLQAFINVVMANEQLRQSQTVRDFFCLDEPPAYSDSMEECRAIFEAQEETIAHLKLQLRAKDDIVRTLQQELNDEIEKNETLIAAVKISYENCAKCTKTLNGLLRESRDDK